MMRFKLSEVLLLFVPAAFLAVLVSGFLSDNSIEWKKFELSALRRAQADHLPAVILCRPRLFWGGRWGRIDEKAIRETTSRSIVAYRHDYVYWNGKSYEERTPEDQWVLDNGGYKEPLLILVSAEGELKAIRGLFFDSPNHTAEIVEFLGLAHWSRFARPVSLFVISLIVSIAVVVYRRRKPSVAD